MSSFEPLVQQIPEKRSESMAVGWEHRTLKGNKGSCSSLLCYQNRLPREILEFPFLELFKACLDSFLCNLVYVGDLL